MKILWAIDALACALCLFGGTIGDLPFDPMLTLVFLGFIWALGNTGLIPS